MYNLTREDIDLEAIRARIAQMTDAELVKYGQSAAWMAEHNDRATWRVQLEEARAEWRRRHVAATGNRVTEVLSIPAPSSALPDLARVRAERHEWRGDA